MMKLTGRDARSGDAILIEADGHGLIRHVDSLLDPRDADDVWISAGFIDLQVNGFAGVDFNSAGPELHSSEPHPGYSESRSVDSEPGPEEAASSPARSSARFSRTPPSSVGPDDAQAADFDLDRAIRAIASTGVTRFFPTVITGAPEAMRAALRRLADARESLEFGFAMEAFHIEGPHISPEDGPRGAHPKEWVRPPDAGEFFRLQDAARGHIRIVTLAPEWPGGVDYIARLTREGVVCAIGHTRASASQIRDAVSAGATLSTHLGNGAGSRTRTEEFITAQMNDPHLAASFIVDDHHLPGEFLHRALEAKGLDRAVLITDAVACALCPPGPHTLGGVEVELHDGERVTLRGGDRLAGSALRMDRAIDNVMRAADLSLAQALALATTNPARVGKIRGRLQGLRRGERADVVRFRTDGGCMEIVDTHVSGRLAYSAMH